ncbi:MAG: hypothetical protein IKR92_04565, partial [Alphaproteobacteria bacterium]|nr:hypothetical protein [Alphaproteobacteria bacterium]
GEGSFLLLVGARNENYRHQRYDEHNFLHTLYFFMLLTRFVKSIFPIALYILPDGEPEVSVR